MKAQEGCVDLGALNGNTKFYGIAVTLFKGIEDRVRVTRSPDSTS